MKKSLLFLLLPLSVYADFTSVDSQNLSNTLQGVEAIRGNQVTLYELLQNFTTYSSSWGGHFIKTVGNAASKFVQEFNSNGWFPAVKASLGVIQADVGRINTALTTVNDHLEIIEGDVSSIKDNTESINTSVESIDSTVTTISNHTSSINDNVILLKNYLNPVSHWAEGAFPWGWTFFLRRRASTWTDPVLEDDFESYDINIDESAVWASRIEQYLMSLLNINSSDNEMIANMLLRESIIQYTQIASTNLLQKILDTNDVWYAKIYDRIPTNLTVVVSNIASNVSNDWRYIAATALSSAPVLYDLTPDRARDVNQSFALVPPQLTGDFKNDVILLLGNMQQISASGASVNMDILTNVQFVVECILSSSAAVGQKIDDERRNAEGIAQDGQSHEHDLDSVEPYFKIKDSNTDVARNLQNASLLPSKLSPLVVSHVANNYAIDVPAFSVFGAGFTDSLQINMDVSLFQGYFDNIRSCFALFWFVFALFIVWKLFILGIRMLGWISSLINPFSFNAGTQGHDLSSFYG